MSPFYAEFIGRMNQYKVLAYNSNAWKVVMEDEFLPEFGISNQYLRICIEEIEIHMTTDGMSICIVEEGKEEIWDPSHESILEILKGLAS